ncbi:hypothetical protein FM038_014830 [Shewanella eurypsychrophilus]|uniref:Uncharacterized protein n=1 Tax=Shewanella eurypsychrophilus TaxID=2593656 RepID=A0ABX6VDH8_9GAMM|nr:MULTISPECIES: hypothetical protein [Shewanella]QFU23332.1 hypothetical protein FS418_16650 [Shewanella sp. YLB-09]QPG58561.1 hypothetical protein FM038_014830 [Shewanella eurypsychrophilus]
MNALVEFEAGRLVDLFDQGDTLHIFMFMDKMNMPIDVQDRLFSEISALKYIDKTKVEHIIESHGQSTIHERLSY